MLTLLLYVVIIAVIAALLFFVASAVFGRGEELEPLPEGTTATVLPAEGVTGADVDVLRFQQTLRGYKQSEVDWVLDRLGAEIDLLRSRLSAAQISDLSASDRADDK
ncbi:DivIVA domain-containing protein [Rhodococcus sp. G-MC3]|uniref:DivIVA domain-containing protein n=1 Tax=Rhodococcus sp. G-MC3 TaxID=3046209 RepID=UPI0024BB9A4D|nr:DivIVA domain-containing protein [Rhodococcus sp. G-MC3]MDJ0392333.1 DivIVA domain-containing protein [Rhodococcus sp. G-MC3]